VRNIPFVLQLKLGSSISSSEASSALAIYPKFLPCAEHQLLFDRSPIFIPMAIRPTKRKMLTWRF
jgi:hypothetical protein